MIPYLTKVTDSQKFALIKLCSQFSKLRIGRLYLLSELIGRKIETTGDVSFDEWRTIRNSAYKKWSDNDWTICDEFKSKCQSIIGKFEEEVLGQIKLDWE